MPLMPPTAEIAVPNTTPMMMNLIALALVCVTTVVLAEMVRRHYLTKQEYRYKQLRLEHDETVLAADGGEEE